MENVRTSHTQYACAFRVLCKSDADQLYKQPKPLSAHVMLPENIEPQSTQVLEVHVMQENKTVDDAKSVQFNVWKKMLPVKLKQ